MCERLNGPWASPFLASPYRTSITARRRHRRCPGMEGAVRRNLGAQAINENGAAGHRSVEGPDTDSPVKSAPYDARKVCVRVFGVRLVRRKPTPANVEVTGHGCATG